MRRVWIIAIPTAIAVLLLCARCRRPEPSPAEPVESPSDTESASEIERADTAGLQNWLDESHPEPNNWLRVERIKDGAEGGWITGGLVEDNRIEIETRDVEQFVIDLSAVPIDWSRRAVLRIDDSSSELTRKHYPLVRLRRSSTGGWSAVTE